MIWILSSDANLETLSWGHLNVSDMKGKSESLSAPLAIIIGASVSLAGSLVAIYLATLASDTQKQQFEIELMKFLDSEYSNSKSALSGQTRAILALLDFVYLRDEVLHRAIRDRDLTAENSITFEELTKIAEDENLHSKLRLALSVLADASLSVQESSLASSLRAEAFKNNKDKFCEYFDQNSENYIRIIAFVGDRNERISKPIMQYAAGLNPSEKSKQIFKQLKIDLLASDGENLYFEAKAQATPAAVVFGFLAAYNVAVLKKGIVVIQEADYLVRDKMSGLASVFGHESIDIIEVNHPETNSIKPACFKARMSESILITGIFDLAKFYWSIPSSDIIERVSENHISGIAPNHSQITLSLKNFIRQKNHEMLEATRSATKFMDIIELTSIPNVRILGDQNMSISNVERTE